MANYTSTANVVLTLNGQQAKQTMAKLQQEAAQLEQKIAAAAQAGDKATMKKLQRELNNTNGMINQLRGSAATTEQVLKLLDKATPKELNKALKQLKAQLNSIERGSKAWDEHQKKIKAVQDEIAKINNAPKEVQTLQQRIGGWWDKLAMKITAAAAAVAGFVAATEKAVAAYASMQAEEAGVGKFTGMSAEEVKELNDAFKQMNTRTSREDLNRLAQDAGRLGKQSVEDVLGFVRAADKINVALDDLGDGATLTLSKLTGVFGDEKRLGTEKALLSVGSVINDLSQNCSASAPYLADFAARMGGVGSQAGFTIPQIVAFGAVLDSNQQGLEVSATALQQLIVRLMQDPAKYAKVAGMDVKKFSDLIKTDMNGALLMFLETLNKTGRMDELAKMFKDMGENGSGSVATLATLAKNIEAVRAQQDAANESYREATSVTNEAAVANSTVEAQLDIQQGKLNELWVTLGERLLPAQLLMNKAQYASVQAMVKVVEFAVKYRREIITVAAAVATYAIAANAAAIKAKAFTVAQTVGSGIAKAYRLTMIGVQAVYALVTGNATRAAAATRAFNAACAANPYGIAFAALTLLIGGIISYVSRTNEAAEETAKLKKEQEDWQKSLTDISQKVSEECAKEMTQLESLYKTAINAAKSTDERRKAAERLQELYPDVFKNFRTEQIMVGEAAQAYDTLRESILKVSRAKAVQAKMEENTGALLDLELELPDLNKKVIEERNAVNKAQAMYDRANNDRDRSFANRVLHEAQSRYQAAIKAYNDNKEKQRWLHSANNTLAAEAALTGPTDAPTHTDTPIVPTPSKPTDKAEQERREAERKAKEETARKVESLKRQRKMDEQQAEIDSLTPGDRLFDNETAKQERLFRIRKNYLTLIRDCYAEGSDERAEAEQAIADNATTYEIDQKKKFVAEFNEWYGKYNEISATDRYNAEMAALEAYYSAGKVKHEDYERIKAKISEKYAQEIDAQLPESARAPKEVSDADKKEADLSAIQSMYDAKLLTEEEYLQSKDRIEQYYADKSAGRTERMHQAEADMLISLMGSFTAAFSDIDGDMGAKMEAIGKAAAATTALMGAVFQQTGEYMQACADLEVAETEKRFKSQIEAAEGNSAKQKQLEKAKEAEIAKIKNEARKKQYNMQIAMAIAQTAANAIQAFGAGLQVGGPAGLILAPLAAAMATAAGLVQIATMRKQQQASEAQGFSRGGFTKPGAVDEPAGVVHAGEWVASQKLVNNPRARQIINALDYAQRTNTIGSLRMADVSRSITAPMTIGAGSAAPVVIQAPAPQVVVQQSPELAASLATLNRRLSEPFVTVNTVTGTHGMQAAQDEYARLMRNKSPKTTRQ